MIRLLVNVPPRNAGSEVERAELGEAFAQQLLDAGQAVEVEAVFLDTPLDLVRAQCFELEDQMDAAAGRLVRIATLSADLDDADRLEVARCMATALRARSEMDLSEVQALLALGMADAGLVFGAAVHADTGPTDTPPTDAGPPGDTTGAPAPVVDPAAPPPAEPAAKSEGGAAKAKKPGG